MEIYACVHIFKLIAKLKNIIDYVVETNYTSIAHE